MRPPRIAFARARRQKRSVASTLPKDTSQLVTTFNNCSIMQTAQGRTPISKDWRADCSQITADLFIEVVAISQLPARRQAPRCQSDAWHLGHGQEEVPLRHVEQASKDWRRSHLPNGASGTWVTILRGLTFVSHLELVLILDHAQDLYHDQSKPNITDSEKQTATRANIGYMPPCR